MCCHRQTNRQTSRQTDRKTDRQTDRQAGRQTDRRTDRQTDTDKEIDRGREGDSMLFSLGTIDGCRWSMAAVGHQPSAIDNRPSASIDVSYRISQSLYIYMIYIFTFFSFEVVLSLKHAMWSNHLCQCLDALTCVLNFVISVLFTHGTRGPSQYTDVVLSV